MSTLLALLVSAQDAGHEAAAAASQQPEAAAATHGAVEAAAHGEAQGPAEILMHHVLDQPFFGLPSKHLVFFLVAALVVILLTRLALRSYDEKRQPRGIGSIVETFVLFVRNDIAEANIGHDGHKFVPLLSSFFFFILIAALLGLLPFAATSTGNLSVTAGLACVSFAAQQWAGISKYGLVGHFKNLVPHGLPILLVPIMIIVEVLSVFTKPFALTVRLFANMIAGHFAITALLLLIPLMAAISPVLGVMIIPVSLGLALFIMLLELLVALIQAYIFTLLTAIFIGMYAHPAH